MPPDLNSDNVSDNEHAAHEDFILISRVLPPERVPTPLLCKLPYGKKKTR